MTADRVSPNEDIRARILLSLCGFTQRRTILTGKERRTGRTRDWVPRLRKGERMGVSVFRQGRGAELVRQSMLSGEKS